MEATNAGENLELSPAIGDRGAAKARSRAFEKRPAPPLIEGLHREQGFNLSPLPLLEGKGAAP